MSQQPTHPAPSAVHLALEDERAIEQLLLRYCAGIDNRDWPLFRTCFTEDLEADYGPFGQWQGGDAITAAMAEMHAPIGPTLHRLSNIRTRRDPDGSVHARSYVDALLTSPAAQGPVRRGIGYYDDRLECAQRDWRINRRKFTAVHLE